MRYVVVVVVVVGLGILQVGYWPTCLIAKMGSPYLSLDPGMTTKEKVNK